MVPNTSVHDRGSRRAGFAERILSPTWREYRLSRTRHSYVFLLAAGVALLLLGLEGARAMVVSVAAASSRVPALQRALTLDPDNPDLENRLGLAYFYSPDHLNNVKALEHLRRATALNPHRSFYWSDLGQACESVGDKPCADRGFDEALKLSPMMPHLYWMAGNHYLSAGQPDTALARFHRLLELSPNYAWSTFDTCLRALGDPDAVLRGVIAPDESVALKINYVVFLSGLGYDAVARRVWAATVTGSTAFAFDLARPYVEHTISSGRYEDAFRTWQDLERLGIVTGREQDNLVFNGGFERAPLNAGFDWRYDQTPYDSVDFADPRGCEGVRCLRLDFTVASNLEFEPVFEYVPIAPGQEYVLTAHVRSQDITSDSGPRLRVSDPECHGCLEAASSMAVGTTPWHQVALTFSTSPQTRLIKLSVWRPPSRTFPFQIAGHFWLDAVLLKPMPLAQKTPGESPPGSM